MPLNVVAPGVVRNREFAAAMAQRVGQPANHAISGDMLRARMGVIADTITNGRRIVPAAALALGYQFQFPQLEVALQDLVPPDAGATTGWNTNN